MKCIYEYVGKTVKFQKTTGYKSVLLHWLECTSYKPFYCIFARVC